jgi:N-acetylglucosaminyldiphosphoundecaprenol N-acetyl-beta-D-mannosaminyltransferase
MDHNYKVDILGIHVNPITINELHSEIGQRIEKKCKSLILNVNVHCMNLAEHNDWLKDFLNSAEIVFCDGAGVMLGAQILGHKIPERITYADWCWKLSEFANKNNYSLFLLGAKPGIATEAEKKLYAKFPNIVIAGTHNGYFDKSFNSRENQQVIQKINSVKPNILIVAFGMPIQERWLMENWPQIDANIALTGGAVFDYLSGRLRRAPRWMTENGLEWLGRLVIEPRRLWRRYLLGNPIFLLRILKQRLQSLNKPKTQLRL